MKTLKKIKLNHYADEELKEREMNLLRGGGDDDEKVCVCKDGNNPNAAANLKDGYITIGGEGSCWMEYGATFNKEIWD
ncbi:MAG: TIGR04149 family rSAM-modified RiPP [Bacteroidaceae bacterium]|nr:TIGR04149 family rSAM-modified RiPP [Bacteroidaceae bacterium]